MFLSCKATLAPSKVAASRTIGPAARIGDNGSDGLIKSSP
jgi:hypothetical protein